MIRPARFAFNEETAGSNAFQKATDQDVQSAALAEFDNFVALLRSKGLTVLVVDDSAEPFTPDSIFPNNWISTHEDGSVYLYPMEAPVRRLERRPDIIGLLGEHFRVTAIEDLSFFEKRSKFLEGTGSLVLDRVNKIAYACISSRTDTDVLEVFKMRSGYDIISFRAVDGNGLPIYHTNVMMSIGRGFAVICDSSITDENSRKEVIGRLQATKHEIVSISTEQMYHFAGNMLSLQNNEGRQLLVMSRQALDALEPVQKSALGKYAELVASPLEVIEQTGGGSARCMIAEIHLPAKQGDTAQT